MSILRGSGAERGTRNITTYGKRLAEWRPSAFGANKKLTPTQRTVMKKVWTRKRRHYKGEEHPVI